MEFVAQLVRASVCGTEGRGFEPHHSPFFSPFILYYIRLTLYNVKTTFLVNFFKEYVKIFI